MGVDTGITSSSSEVLILSIWNVHVSPRISEAFGQAEINEVDYIAPFAQTHQKVVRFDVPDKAERQVQGDWLVDS